MSRRTPVKNQTLLDAQKQTSLVQIQCNQFIPAHVRLQPACDVKLFTATLRPRVHLIPAIKILMLMCSPCSQNFSLGLTSVTDTDQKWITTCPALIKTHLCFLYQKRQLINMYNRITTCYWLKCKHKISDVKPNCIWPCVV